MGTKLLKLTSLLLLAATLTGCPGEEECFAPAAITQVDDLILISPFQQIYNQGDVITFSVTIPATNNYFNDGTEINLLEATIIGKTKSINFQNQKYHKNPKADASTSAFK